jgi:uncharacterized protein YlxW (UPF0749 family)
MSSDQPSRPPVDDGAGAGRADPPPPASPGDAATTPGSSGPHGHDPTGGAGEPRTAGQPGRAEEPDAAELLDTAGPGATVADAADPAATQVVTGSWDDEPTDGPAPTDATGTAGEPVVADPAAAAGAIRVGSPIRARRRRDPLAAALIGVLTLLLGFAIAVQVRNTGADELLVGAREEDLVRILDELNAREDRLREQIADQRGALQQLNSSDSRSAAALEEARRRAEAIGILNGTVAAHGPGLEMTIRDPEGEVRVADILDAIQELRGAGAETMQIDDVRVGVSTAVTGEPGALAVDGQRISSPYQFLVIGSPQNMETAMNIPGGVVQRITGRGGSVTITQSQDVVVGALRSLDTPQYASPKTDE